MFCSDPFTDAKSYTLFPELIGIIASVVPRKCDSMKIVVKYKTLKENWGEM